MTESFALQHDSYKNDDAKSEKQPHFHLFGDIKGYNVCH